jgi:hypothetical protein
LLLGFSGPRVGALGTAALVALVGVLAFGAAGLVLVVIWLPIALSAFVRIGGQPTVEWFRRGSSSLGVAMPARPSIGPACRSRPDLRV